MPVLAKAELSRRMRVADMMLSMHARLRDRYSYRALWLDVLALSGSAVIVATTFFDPKLIPLTKLDENDFRAVAGIASVTLFILTVVSLRVDWKEASARHARATSALGELKAKATGLSLNASDASYEQDFARAYDNVMATLPPIPDSQFAALKAYHLRKMALSEAVSRNAGAPLFLLQLRLLWRDARAAMVDKTGTSE